MDWQIVEAIATCVAAWLAGGALWQAKVIYNDQQKISEKIHKDQQSLSEELHRQQMVLTQRQLFVQLFGHFQGLRTINPEKPNWVDISATVNFLDLLGVCWEGQLIDEQILLRAFRRVVIDAYNRIERCTNPPSNVEKDGKTMLMESPAAVHLYDRLMKEYLDQDMPDRIQEV